MARKTAEYGKRENGGKMEKSVGKTIVSKIAWSNPKLALLAFSERLPAAELQQDWVRTEDATCSARVQYFHGRNFWVVHRAAVCEHCRYHLTATSPVLLSESS